MLENPKLLTLLSSRLERIQRETFQSIVIACTKLKTESTDLGGVPMCGG